GVGVAVRVLGHNLGTSGNLIPDGPGVTYQGFTYWSPDEIDAYFNIDSTAVTQNITVSVGTDDTGNSFQQRTGDPLSQSQGTGQISIVPITVSLTPSTLNLSTGDTNKYITTSVFPSNIPFTVVYSTGLASPQP